MNLDFHQKYADIVMEIPVQSGLLFEVHLNLQNVDELHLSASALRVEWFPCTKPNKVEEYFEAVSGLLSGQYRILEHRRGKRAVRAELQRADASGFETITNWLDISVLIPWPRKHLRSCGTSPVGHRVPSWPANPPLPGSPESLASAAAAYSLVALSSAGESTSASLPRTHRPR